MSVKLLALAASTRAGSYNRRLLSIAIAEAQAAGAEVTMLDYAQCEAPIYHGEPREIPPGAQVLSQALRAHDGLLLASPEYNWSVPGGLKNLIDWLSTDPTLPLKNRTALLMCATTSQRSGIMGLQHLRVPLELLGMWVYPQLVGIGDAQHRLGDIALTLEKDKQHLTSCVTDFIATTRALREVAHA